MIASCAYQITMLIRRRMTLFRLSKKSLKGFPSGPTLPRVRPKAREKTSSPSVFIPSDVLSTGTLSSSKSRWCGDSVITKMKIRQTIY